MAIKDNFVEKSERNTDDLRADWGLDIHSRQGQTEKDAEEVLQHHQWYPSDF